MDSSTYFKKEDIIFNEVLNPAVRWCKSGHAIPEDVRVYSVQGPALSKHFWGQYCDLCVRCAHQLAKKKKVIKKDSNSQEVVPAVSLNVLMSQLFRAGLVGGLNEKEEHETKEQWEIFLEELG